MPSRRASSRKSPSAWLPRRTTKSRPGSGSTLVTAVKRTLPSRRGTAASRRTASAAANARPALAVLATGAAAIVAARRRRNRDAADVPIWTAEPAQFEPAPPPIPLPDRPAALATPVVPSAMPLAVTAHTAEHEGPATPTAEHEGPATPTAEHEDRDDGPSAA